MRAIVFIVRLANLAVQTSPDLSTDTHAIAHLDSRYLVSNLDCFSDNLVTDAKRKVGRAPATRYGMYVRAANTAGILTVSV